MLGLLIVEVGSYIYVKNFSETYLTKWEFRKNKPPPYYSADYFSDDFINESRYFVKGNLKDLIELEDYKGNFFNVLNGFRFTTDTPFPYKKRVLLFGGSTLFSQEVPDKFTIASYLQRELKEKGVIVKNYGLPGMNSRQQYEVLKKTMLKKNDMVIFYHGVNDVYYNVFFGESHGWVNGVPAFRPVKKINFFEKMIYKFNDNLGSVLFSPQLLNIVALRQQPLSVKSEADLKINAELAVKSFKKYINLSNDLVIDKGGQFVNILQPILFGKKDLTKFQSEILANPYLTAYGSERAFFITYPKLRQTSNSELKDIKFYDFSEILHDDYLFENEIWFDFCHINHEGNEYVAKIINEKIFISE
jgi:lysophospholipase L1-like esterase